MLLWSIVMMGMAIALYQLTHRFKDDVMLVAVLLGAGLCAVLSLLLAPFIVQLVLLITFLIYLNRRLQPAAP